MTASVVGGIAEETKNKRKTSEAIKTVFIVDLFNLKFQAEEQEVGKHNPPSNLDGRRDSMKSGPTSNEKQ